MGVLVLSFAVLLSPMLLAFLLISPLAVRTKVYIAIAALVVLTALPLAFLFFGSDFGT